MKRSTFVCLVFLVFFSFGFQIGVDQEGNSKIYLYNTTLFRTTPGEGIKFYDISNPYEPREVGEIELQGNQDVAVQGKYLYADNGGTLVVYDITDFGRPKVVDSVPQLFNTYHFFGNDVVETGYRGCGGCQEDYAMSAPQRTFSNAEAGGQGGSMARFTIVGDYLYCVDYANLIVCDVSDPAHPKKVTEVNVAWQIETVFPYQDKLFIGGTRGMYIYDIADPTQPKMLGEFPHTRSCDPVVVEGNRAYVTLRSGVPCNDGVNELQIIDITNINTPRLLKRVPMTNPRGLSVRNGIVPVCDGPSGLKIIDASDPDNPKQIGAITDINPYDIILSDQVMVVTAETGFYLYSARDLSNPVLYTRLNF